MEFNYDTKKGIVSWKLPINVSTHKVIFLNHKFHDKKLRVPSKTKSTGPTKTIGPTKTKADAMLTVLP